MKQFVINKHGRIVLPFNFFPEMDFSVIETLEHLKDSDFSRFWR